MINITDPRSCCGCTACANICTHSAISMEPDTLGFLYPKIDKNKCVECGLCEKVCSFNKDYDKTLNLKAGPVAYAVRHKDIHQIETSRSGAAFVAFSDWVLDNGGVVYGAGFAENFKVLHKRAVTKEERDEFKGSKYVQSDLGNTFLQVKKDLKNGLIVLFSGTPCQTSGLNSFVGKKFRKNLILVDIVCHGVPSPYVWRDNIDYIKKKHKSIIINVDFRSKKKGWDTHVEFYKFKNNKECFSELYTRMFYQNIMLRKSCYSCHFSNLIRPSDITLADFWGWERNVESFNKDNKGCSLILCNTQKGHDLFEKLLDKVYYHKVDIKNCMQPNLLYPSVSHPKRILFERDYKKYGFKYVLYKYTMLGYLSYKIKQKLKIIK